MLNTIKKVGPVLELFTAERPEWRMTEIAHALEMPKSSAHALVATLADIGLLSLSSTGGYRLGWNLFSLSERMRVSLDFREHAVPSMRELAHAVRETVLLAALDRRDVVYVERVEGNHPMVRLAGVRPGARLPAHATSCGKMLLAHRSADEVRAVMADVEWRAYTPRTITSMEQLEAELAQVRRQGYALERGEIVADIACIAAPVIDRYGSVVAAVSVSVPAYRFPQQPAKLLEPLREAVATISRRLAQSNQAPVVEDVPWATSPD